MLENTEKYLKPTRFIDCDNPLVRDYAMRKTSENKSAREKIVDLYYAVRDDILYDPYHLILRPEAISASQTLLRGTGYCIEKSLLLAACGRVHGVPARLGFSIVQNHLSTQKFRDMLRSDKFVFHGYNEFLIDGKWVKCTPAFNKSLCEKFGTAPLDFDGIHDSIFQEYHEGKKYMTYIHEYGQFDDLPFELFAAELKKHYPHLFEGVQRDAPAWDVNAFKD
ncbi:MAG: transglutaminase family protein [Chitinophagales bacterium]|nr:transglutaminase family protein [Chitinophagales bacterium]MDW8418740.1 transglutaminase family protein [Chitinophagales bacterium]